MNLLMPCVDPSAALLDQQINSKNMPIHTNDDIGFAPDIDSASDNYAKRFSGVAGEWLLKKQQTLTQQHLLALNAKRVLDVGGGHAQNVEPIEALNIPLTVSGSDAICQNRVLELSHSQQTDFMLGDLDNLPTADQSYPIVISYRIGWVSDVNYTCR